VHRDGPLRLDAEKVGAVLRDARLKSALEHTWVVMPHFIPCPWCRTLIVDWFHELYPQPRYAQIKIGQMAMDCPHHQRRQPVTLNKGKLVPAQNLVTAQRSLLQAEIWAVQQQGYPTLEAFLTQPDEQPRAKYFRSGCWPQINV
jgi:hypothetical protein